MKIKTITLVLLALNFHFSFSQNLDLSTLTIPDSLTKNANSVVRLYDTNIELVSHKKMIIKTKKAVTVLNKLGDYESKIRIFYDQNKKIRSLKTIIYNEVGDELKKVSKNKFIDFAAVDGISLYNDGRLKYFGHVPASYPYTIYYEYEIETSNTAFIPAWMPIDSYRQAVEQSNYEITFSNDLKIQKKENSFNGFNIESTSNENSISYSLKGIKPIEKEDYSPSIEKLLPSVKLMTNKFNVEGIDGQAQNWKELGKWQYENFYKDIGQLPSSTKAEIKRLVSNIEDPIEKARVVYKYVQDKTRYISVQVGIGGLRPMLVEDVDKLGYGDCKALTNYTKSLLEAVGVESYFTELYGDSEKLNMDYNSPYIQGNHVILNIPNGTDDIWLECTSQTVPFGYVANFTDDRDVVVIKPEGGFLKHTTFYNEKKNLQTTRSEYTLDNMGNLKADLTISSEGAQYGKHYELENKPKKDYDKYYKNYYWSYINNIVIKRANFDNDKRAVLFKEELELIATDYASLSENRMIFMINVFNRNNNVPKRYRNRKFDLEISRGYFDQDEYIVNIPENYSFELIPESVSIQNKFGHYNFSVEKISANKLKYTRELLIKQGNYPKQEYSSYRKFKKRIARLDQSKIILTKN